MKIKELSIATSTPISTIRYYEKIELLPIPTKSTNGYRRYSNEFIDYVNIINYLTSLDFSLKEIKQLFMHAQNNTLTIEFLLEQISLHKEKIDTKLENLQNLNTVFKESTKDPSSIVEFFDYINKTFPK